MNSGSLSQTRRWRLASTVTLLAVVLGGATACGGDGTPPGGEHSAAVVPNADLAAKSLASGLKAHAAGQLGAATADYERTLTYDPKNKYAFYNLALIDAAQGNYGLAEDKYRSALESDPGYEPALFNLAIIRTARDDPKEAISLYRRAVAADKTDAAARLNLGLLLRANGQKRAGDKSVLRAIELDAALVDPAEGG
jgi:tetratricopeptide (TPR) repeat protein